MFFKVQINPVWNEIEFLLEVNIIKSAIAGTLESSDAFVRVEPGEGVKIDLESSVMDQYGNSILASVREVLTSLDITDIFVSINDKGALDCTLRTRVETAIFRACDAMENIPWGTKI